MPTTTSTTASSSQEILARAEALQWRNDRPAFIQSIELLDALPPADQAHPHALTLRAHALWRLDIEEQVAPLFDQIFQHPQIHNPTHSHTYILASLRFALINTYANQTDHAHIALNNARQKIASSNQHFPTLQAHLDLQQGRTFLAENNPEQAAPFFQKSIPAFIALDDLYRATWSLHLLAKIYDPAQGLDEDLLSSFTLLLTKFHDNLTRAPNLSDHEHKSLWQTATWLAHYYAVQKNSTAAYQLIRNTYQHLQVAPKDYLNSLHVLLDVMCLDAQITAEIYDEIFHNNLEPEFDAQNRIALADLCISLGDNEHARDLCQYVLTTYHLEPDDHTWARAILAMALLNLGEQADAAYVLPTPDEIIPLNDTALLLFCGRANAILWGQRGGHLKALDLLQNLLPLANDPDRTDQKLYLLATQALIASEINNFTLAKNAIENATQLLEQSPEPNNIGHTLLVFANAYLTLQQGLFQEAATAFQNASNLATVAGQKNLYRLSLLNLFASISLLNNNQKTLQLADELEPEVSDYPMFLAILHYHRGFSHDALGNTTLAIRSFEHAARGFAQTGRILAEAEALDSLAILEPNLIRATTHARKALQLILALATFLDTESQRLHLLTRSRHIGARLIALHLEQNNLTAALAAIFEVKSGDFLRLLHERRPALAPEELTELQQSTTSAKAPLAPFSSAMHMRTGDPRASHRVLEKYMELVRTHPHATAQIINPHNILPKIGPDRLALEYFLTDFDADHFFIFIIHDGQLTCRRQSWSPEDSTRVTTILERIRGLRGVGSTVHARQLQRALMRFYDIFFAPIEDFLSNPNLKRLTLAPGAGLIHVPFQACLMPDTTPIINRFAIDFTITLGQLAVSQNHSTHAFQPTRAAIWRPTDLPSKQRQQTHLPEADREVQWLQKTLTQHNIPTTFVQQWQDPTLTTANLIHYAGHTYAHEHNLALGSPDNLLTPADLLDIHLTANPLVVLSACDSGTTIAHGDEFTGLLRALFAAGAHHIICSSWRAHDEGTHELMKQFYPALLNGQAPTNALTTAANLLASSPGHYAHPFYWANFRCFTAT